MEQRHYQETLDRSIDRIEELRQLHHQMQHSDAASGIDCDSLQHHFDSVRHCLERAASVLTLLRTADPGSPETVAARIELCATAAGAAELLVKLTSRRMQQIRALATTSGTGNQTEVAELAERFETLAADGPLRGLEERVFSAMETDDAMEKISGAKPRKEEYFSL